MSEVSVILILQFQWHESQGSTLSNDLNKEAPTERLGIFRGYSVDSVAHDQGKTRYSKSQIGVEELNQSQSVGMSIVIGVFFRFSFRLRQSGVYLSVNDRVVSGVRRKSKRSDSSDFDFFVVVDVIIIMTIMVTVTLIVIVIKIIIVVVVVIIVITIIVIVIIIVVAVVIIILITQSNLPQLTTQNKLE